MKIAVLGATGATGKEVVRQALQEGHEVTAVVRTPSKITEQHENLKVKEADLFDEASVTNALQGQEAVVSCLGFPKKPEPVTGYVKSADSIISAMRSNNISRLVCMTAWYTDTSHAARTGFFASNFIVPMIKPMLVNMREMEIQMETMAQDINYTVVRPPGLTNGKATGLPMVAKEDFLVEANSLMPICRVSRGDVASFMLSCLKTNLYDRKMVSILN